MADEEWGTCEIKDWVEEVGEKKDGGCFDRAGWADGGGVTWYEPTAVKTASNPAEVLPPGIAHVYDGSSVTLNWSYSLTLGLGLGGLVIKFNWVGTVSIRSADGSTGMILSVIIFRNGSA